METERQDLIPTDGAELLLIPQNKPQKVRSSLRLCKPVRETYEVIIGRAHSQETVTIGRRRGRGKDRRQVPSLGVEVIMTIFYFIVVPDNPKDISFYTTNTC